MSAAEVLALLQTARHTLAVAESLTGGLLAAELVAVPGASAVFRGGIIAYATDLKHTLLGVDPYILAGRGAVDREVAVQMARGVRDRLGAGWGLATTGVAGPDAQDGRSPGTVFVALAGPGYTQVRCLSLTGDRATIRRSTVGAALDLTLAGLREHGA